MPKIGIILAGGASKGAYEIGCLRAIEEAFGMENIKSVSSASIGSLITQAYGVGRIDEFERIWKNIDPKQHGRFFLTYSGNKDILGMIDNMIDTDVKLPFEHYVSIWNYTQSKVEYAEFHKLEGEELHKYIRGAIAIPFFSKGETVDGDLLIDGAFLDNIPAYPLLDKDLDYIFCVYFDNCKYCFENPEFDSKIIKLFDFPNEKMLEMMTFHPENFDNMVQYGYDYTKRVIGEIFVSDNRAEVLRRIEDRANSQEVTYTPRLTADIVLNNINVYTKRYSKRLTSRVKEK